MSKPHLIKSILILLLCCVYQIVEAQSGRPGIISPEVHPDKTVTFRFMAKDAREVKLSTQFVKESQPMIKDASGLWSITLGPVSPDIYPYCFIADGVQMADPNNVSVFPNETFKNSIVDIPGDTPLVHAFQDVPHGTLSYRFYYSGLLGVVRPLVVYTPPGYENGSKTTYPVLYLLHGTTDTEETWTKVGKANLILDNLIAQGNAKPMIVVMPYGRAFPQIPTGAGSLRNWDNLQLFQKDFLENIVPYTEQNFRVKTDRESRAIAGFSGGGGTSLFIGLGNPNLFASVIGFAPGMKSEEFERNNAVPFANPEKTNERLKLFWIGVGKEDGLYGVIQDYLKILDEKKIKHQTFITTGGHTWMNCKLFLTKTTQLLFK